MKKLFKLLFFLLLLSNFSGYAMASLLTNGDFETGDLTGWTWTADSNAEPTMNATVDTFGGSSAFRVNPGNDSGEGGGELGGTLSQLVSVSGGENYTITGDLAIQNITDYNNADGGTIQVFLDSTLLHTFDIESIPAGNSITDHFSVLYTSILTESISFELKFTRGWMNYSPVIYHWADNLSITGDPIPEPATMLLFGFGLIGLAGVSRRKE